MSMEDAIKRRPDKTEREKRIRIVMDWILSDRPTADIIDRIMEEWSVEQRQAYRYLKEAHKKWIKETTPAVIEDFETKIRLKIIRLNRLKNSIDPKLRKTPAGIRAVLAVEREIIELERLKAPPVNITNNSVEQKIIYVTQTNVDYSKLPDHVLLEIAKARKKEEA